MPLSWQAYSPAKPSFHFPPWLPEGDTETTVQMTNFGTPASPHCQYNHLHSGKFCWVSHHRAECYLNAKRDDGGVINSASWGAPVDSNILSSPRLYSLNASLWHNMSEQACYNFLCLWITVVFGGRVQKKKKCEGLHINLESHVQTLAPVLKSCVTLGKWVTVSESQ